MRSLFRALIDSQVRLSRWFDRRLPVDYRVDGNRQYLDTFAPRHLHQGEEVWDLGGGKNPFVDVETKQRLGLRVVGLDISQDELDRAPAGAYDRTVCADVTRHRGAGEADVVFCQALLEHVPDTRAALDAIAGLLKPGGRAVLFVPSGNAVFARLNRLLPERVKRAILFTVFPSTRRNQGFPAYYDRCTPGDFRRMASSLGLDVEEVRPYYCSAYFTCCFPVHVVWRLWLMAFRGLAGEQAAETFSMTLRKPGPARDAAADPAMARAA